MTHTYPEWVCNPCGRTYGNSPVALCTWHQDICGICGKLTAVCEPRDFRHLKDGWQTESPQASTSESSQVANSPVSSNRGDV
jgi:hypothetical protein